MMELCEGHDTSNGKHSCLQVVLCKSNTGPRFVFPRPPCSWDPLPQLCRSNHACKCSITWFCQNDQKSFPIKCISSTARDMLILFIFSPRIISLGLGSGILFAAHSCTQMPCSVIAGGADTQSILHKKLRCSATSLCQLFCFMSLSNCFYSLLI